MVVLFPLSLLAVGTAISPSQWAYVGIASSLTLLAMTKRGRFLAMTNRGKGDTAGDELPRYGDDVTVRLVVATSQCLIVVEYGLVPDLGW